MRQTSRALIALRRGRRRLSAEVLRAAIFAALLVASGTGAKGQEESAEGGSPADPWAALRLLEGDWEGEIGGKLGAGTGIRRYDWLKEDRFLRVRHRSVRLPQEKSPQGDEHEELGVFSFDGERDTLVYREFMMGEEVVVRSTCDTAGLTVVCVSESVEGGPGFRARLTLEIEDRYHFTEIYELGWPGRELEHYFTSHWTRSPRGHRWDRP